MDASPPIELVAILGGVVLLATIVTLLFARRLIHVCGPNDVLVVSGRRGPSGLPYRIVTGGRTIHVPIIERVDRLDASPLRCEVRVSGAFTRGNVRATIELTVEARIAKHDAAVLRNAIERFLGRPRDEMAQVVSETLEGHVRGVVAGLELEQIRKDLRAFKEELIQSSHDDLAKLGFVVDRIEIVDVRGPRTLGAS